MLGTNIYSFWVVSGEFLSECLRSHVHFLWHLHCFFWPSCNPDYAIFLVLKSETAEFMLHHLESFCLILYMLLSYTVSKVEHVNILKLGVKTWSSYTWASEWLCSNEHLKLHGFRWSRKLGSVDLFALNLLNKQVQISHFWCCSLTHFISECVTIF